MLFLAVVLAAIFGDMNFWYNMQPFYDIENLNTYPSVDPATQTGILFLIQGALMQFTANTVTDTLASAQRWYHYHNVNIVEH